MNIRLVSIMKVVLTRLNEGSVLWINNLFINRYMIIQVQSTAVPKETGKHIYIK